MAQPPRVGHQLALALALICLAFTGRGERVVVPLDGRWGFRLDPGDAGRSEQWFTDRVGFTNTIQVPGAWQAQGYGKDGDKLRHNYEGKAWYKRQVRLPTAPGRRLFLCVGGVHRSAEIWINGEYLGKHVGYTSPFEFELPAATAASGRATITFCVDSAQHWDMDCLTGALDFIDEMFTPWGGIWGHVWLEARPHVWMEEVSVESGLAPTAYCGVIARVVGQTDWMQVRLEVRSKRGTRLGGFMNTVCQHEGQLVVGAKIPQAKLWSPEEPNLYIARVELLDKGVVVDRAEIPFGVREIRVEGHDFLLNGKKLFLRGYGDDCIYPQTMAPPADKQLYRRKLQAAKDYGFNFVRHHSHFLAPEYYEAADEVGMLVSPELPIAYQEYYAKAAGPALGLYKTEWAASIKRLRNHPSIFDWCMGNELYNSTPIGPDLYRAAKHLDPTRLVIDSDGLPGSFLPQALDRPTLDFFSVQFEEHALPLDNPGKHRFAPAPKKPVVSHETGNYITAPRLDLIEHFKDNIKPFWLEPFRAKMEKLGLTAEARQWSLNSERLYYLAHKLNLEDLRKNPWLSGYEWWLLQDYWTGANGLFDAYFRPKSIRPASVRQFNAPTVLLLDGLPVTCSGGQAVKLKLLVSNYSPDPVRDGNVRCTVKVGERVVASRRERRVGVGQGELAETMAMVVDLPPVSRPEQLVVKAELRATGKTIHNDWSSWVYPEPDHMAPPALGKTPLFASHELWPLLKSFGARLMPVRGALPTNAVFVVTQPDFRALTALQAGASVICLSPLGIFPSVPNHFKPAWWLGSASDCNAGTVVYSNPVTREIAPGGWCDAGWYRLLEGAQAYVLDDVPFARRNGAPEVQPVLVRALDVHTVCRNKALLFEARVGSGCLLVCGLRLEPQPDAPERRWILKRLVEYAGTFPRPKAALPASFLRARAAQTALPEGPFVSGFARLTSQGPEQTEYPSCREAQTLTYVCRQLETGRSLEWETAVVPADWSGTNVTFVFAGGLGWISQPKSSGFALLLDGRELVTFDVTGQGQSWSGESGEARLRFVPSKNLPEDALGLFYLTLPAAHVKRGAPVRLTVRSNAKDSRRWFGLNPYSDLSE